MQFDCNPKFKTDINKMTAEELRSQPIGKDKMGHAYWLQCDENCQLRVYKEDPDEETWALVAKYVQFILFNRASCSCMNKNNLEHFKRRINFCH